MSKIEEVDTVSLDYLQEALLFEEKINDTTRIKLYRSIANTYKNLQSHYLSLTYYYKELDLQKKLNPSKTFYIQNNIAGCYYFLDDKKKAREFWGKSLEGFERFMVKNPDSIENIEATLIYNNLAVLEMNEGNNVRALDMLKRFKQQNEKAKDTLNIIMAYENLSSVYKKLKNKEEAKQSLRKGMALATKINSAYDLASLSNEMGKLYFETLKKKDSSLFYLQQAFNISSKNNFRDIKLSSAEKLVAYFEERNDYKQSLFYSKKAKEISEQVLKLDNSKKITSLEFQYNQKLKQERALVKQKRREIFLTLGIIALFLFSIIVFLMFKLQKSKTQKRTIENKLLAEKLKKKNKELTGNALQIIQSNEILKQTQHKLKSIRNDSQLSVLSNLINTLKTGTQAFNKAEFEKIFMETEENFYKNLISEYPNLTKNEIRLCAFLKLNLSTKEIAAITQKTAHSIVVARSRLRKKLKIKKNQDLSVFLNKF